MQGCSVLSHGLSAYQRRPDDPVNRIKTRGADEGFLLFAIAFSDPWGREIPHWMLAESPGTLGYVHLQDTQ